MLDRYRSRREISVHVRHRSGPDQRILDRHSARPSFVQNFSLGGPEGTLPSGTPEPETYTTAPFNLSVDPSGQYLYVVNHETCTSVSIDATNCPDGNAIHIMSTNPDGTLTENSVVSHDLPCHDGA
jgi:hypothetical protein